MRRILAALALIIAPLLPVAPAVPAHAQTVPGTLLSISPTSGGRGTTVQVAIQAGGVQPPYSLITGTGIQVSSDQLVLVDGFSNERLQETFVIAADAPLGPSSVSVVGSNGTTNSLAFEITPAPAAQQSVSVAPGATASAAVLPTLAGQSGLSATLTHSALATSTRSSGATGRARSPGAGPSAGLSNRASRPCAG